jgi:hypothetical protein
MLLFSLSNGYISTLIMLATVVDPSLEVDEIDVRPSLPSPRVITDDEGGIDCSDVCGILFDDGVGGGEFDHFPCEGLGVWV